MFKLKEQSTASMSTKNQPKNQKIKKNKKSAIKNILIAGLIAVSSISIFAGIKVTQIQSVINHNDALFSSIDTKEKAQKVLFNESYTDEDFKKDLHVYEELTKLDNGTNKALLYMLFTEIEKKNPNINIEEYVKYSQEGKIIKYLKDNTKKEDRVGQFMFMYGISPTIHYFGSNLENAFNEKYGDKSYYRYFTSKSTSTISEKEIGFSFTENQSLKDFNDSQKVVYNKLQEAYENKDYDTLKLYFKQYHEYLNFISDIRNSSISTAKAGDASYVDSIISTGVFIPYLLIKDGKDYKKINKDLILGIN